MKVSIEQIDRYEARHLILSAKHHNVAPEQLTSLNDFLLWAESIWVGRVDGDMICVLGLVPETVLSQKAYLWMFHTNLVGEHTFLFVRYSQIMMKEMLKKYPTITGYAASNDPRARKWLEWLGATFEDTKEKYIPFKIEAKYG